MRIQPSLLASAIAFALAAGSTWAEQKPMPTNPGQPSGTPTSTPTWTAPGAQPSHISIKTKSSPAVVPQNPEQIEERSANPGQPSGGEHLRGIEKKDIRRGMVIAKPQSKQPGAPIPPGGCGPTKPGDPTTSTC
ncbi:MAG: hypothetical protein KatS3mg122_0826 [Caldimonas sp.]|uniref:hypothetical protein n=1 Tax=Caldimonas taiwanensis TaxID=307483 RepID=UPI000A6DF233|nr:hypothetical protein [Caldimonas taiwanensis]GIX23595.1 MAG: hypothetical protein KatS3mg122_0826 [Caldimonas sp.]